MKCKYFQRKMTKVKTKFIKKPKQTPKNDAKVFVFCVVSGYSVCPVLQEVEHIRYKRALFPLPHKRSTRRGQQQQLGQI